MNRSNEMDIMSACVVISLYYCTAQSKISTTADPNGLYCVIRISTTLYYLWHKFCRYCSDTVTQKNVLLFDYDIWNKKKYMYMHMKFHHSEGFTHIKSSPFSF